MSELTGWERLAPDGAASYIPPPTSAAKIAQDYSTTCSISDQNPDEEDWSVIHFTDGSSLKVNAGNSLEIKEHSAVITRNGASVVINGGLIHHIVSHDKGVEKHE